MPTQHYDNKLKIYVTRPDCILCGEPAQHLQRNSDDEIKWRNYCDSCHKARLVESKRILSAIDSQSLPTCLHPECQNTVVPTGVDEDMKPIISDYCSEHLNILAVNPREKKDYCENRSGNLIKGYPQPCTTTILSPSQLDVDHIDGDPWNRDPSNYQTLCAACHRLKTIAHGDNKTAGRKTKLRQAKNIKMMEDSGLFDFS